MLCLSRTNTAYCDINKMHTDIYRCLPNSCLLREVFDKQDITPIAHMLSNEID
ncbi:MAG: hypothetical protein ACI9Y1_001484 [Lentisphaeria bacterium]|jgi:hypothetical protein